MKKLILVLPFLALCNAYAAAPRSEVQPLIEEWKDVYPYCKGNPNREEWRFYCNKVSEIYDKLGKKGWCFQGPTKDSPTADFRFRACRENTYEETVANSISQWESAKEKCQKIPHASTEDKAFQEDMCKEQLFFKNDLRKHGWCFDNQADSWIICPTNDPRQQIPNRIKHWKVLAEKCPNGFNPDSKYCRRLPDFETELKNAGYCLKRKPSPAKTAIWGKCR